jgi:hypothetical protein
LDTELGRLWKVIQAPVGRHPTLGEYVVVKQNGVPGVGLHPLGIAHLVLENLEFPAEILQVQIGAAALLAIGRAHPLGQGRKVQRGHFLLEGLQGDGDGFPPPPHPGGLLAFQIAGQGLGGFAQVGAALQVFPFLDDLGGKGQTGALAAFPAVGAGQGFYQFHNSKGHAWCS